MHDEAVMNRDESAIRDTVLAVARGADLHQWDAVRAAFADAVELDYGAPEHVSPREIVARWQPLLSAFESTHHVISDIAVVVTGDHADVRSRFEATHVMNHDRWVLTGRYEHALVRSSTGWKITRMKMIPGESSGNAGLLDLAKATAAKAPSVDERDRNRELVRSFFGKLEAFDVDGFVALFAPDGRQLMPFAPEGFPTHLDGRDAIANQYRALPQNFASMKFPDLKIVDTAEASMFVATFRGEIALKSGGRYDNTYLGVFVIRDGHIAEYTEYFNPIVLLNAFGGGLQKSFNVKP
jgi:ketosteroid isomerase-like protein